MFQVFVLCCCLDCSHFLLPHKTFILGNAKLDAVENSGKPIATMTRQGTSIFVNGRPSSSKQNHPAQRTRRPSAEFWGTTRVVGKEKGCVLRPSSLPFMVPHSSTHQISRPDRKKNLGLLLDGLGGQALGVLDVDGLNVAVELLLGALLVVSSSGDADAESEWNTLDTLLPNLLVQLGVQADIGGALLYHLVSKFNVFPRAVRPDQPAPLSPKLDCMRRSNLIFSGSGGSIFSRGGCVLSGEKVLIAYHRLVRESLDLLDGAGSSLLEGHTVHLFARNSISILYWTPATVSSRIEVVETDRTYSLVEVDGVLASDHVGDGRAALLAGLLGGGRHF